VRFLGYRADVRPFYHAIDVHLSSSLGSETSSLALAEGMSAALPTLASDTPGNRARLGTGGFLFPAGDDAALASLFLLLRARDTRERLSRAAEARAKTLPTWEDVKESYRALFAAFCDKLPPNGCIFGKDMLS
jgi:glycosyltransferase involved in cell wall biosynthesis